MKSSAIASHLTDTTQISLDCCISCRERSFINQILHHLIFSKYLCLHAPIPNHIAMDFMSKLISSPARQKVVKSFSGCIQLHVKNGRSDGSLAPHIYY